MTSAVPTLGYPSRTDAAVGMRAQGKTTREIASALGITPKQVSSLESSRRRVAARGTPATQPGRKPSSDLASRFPFHLLDQLRPHAARRDIPIDRLIRMIVERVVEDGLVDAVLDDCGAAHPSTKRSKP